MHEATIPRKTGNDAVNLTWPGWKWQWRIIMKTSGNINLMSLVLLDGISENFVGTFVVDYSVRRIASMQ